MSFSVTPQIAGDSVVTLSVTPVVSSPAVFEPSTGGKASWS
jgi:hypothetical protein